MDGRVIAGGMVAIALGMGAGLWYAQNYAWYDRVEGLSQIAVQGQDLPVSDYQGIDAETSPLKLRGCFTVDWPDLPEAQDDAVPLRAPFWFDCFDAGQIEADLNAGAAMAVLASKNEPFGFSTYIARYPDGRAFLWRQINDCGTAQFAGDPLPPGCDDSTNAPSVQSDVTAPTAPSTDTASLAISDTATPDDPPTSGPSALVMSPGDGLPGQDPADLPLGLMGVVSNKIEPMLHSNLQSHSHEGGFWGCFDTTLSFGLLSEAFIIADTVEITPPPLPNDLPCFKAGALTEDIQTGTAMALYSTPDVAPGTDRMIAVYGDGRGFVWHQPSTPE